MKLRSQELISSQLNKVNFEIGLFYLRGGKPPIGGGGGATIAAGAVNIS